MNGGMYLGIIGPLLAIYFVQLLHWGRLMHKLDYIARLLEKKNEGADNGRT